MVIRQELIDSAVSMGFRPAPYNKPQSPVQRYGTGVWDAEGMLSGNSSVETLAVLDVFKSFPDGSFKVLYFTCAADDPTRTFGLWGNFNRYGAPDESAKKILGIFNL